jgi:hypothetical protein
MISIFPSIILSINGFTFKIRPSATTPTWIRGPSQKVIARIAFDSVSTTGRVSSQFFVPTDQRDRA